MGRPLGGVGGGGVRQVKPGRLQALIVNADDYGLTASVNRAIEAAHAAGVVTSTSVMVNQAHCGDVVDLPLRRPQLGIGLHLTLTLGTPISEPAKVRTLVDSDGRFLGRETLIGRLRAGQVAPPEIVRECSAQLERLRSLGIDADHWNVHQHLQEHVALGAVIARAMRDDGLCVSRNPRRVRVEPTLSPKGLSEVAHARRRRRGEKAITDLHSTPDALLDARPSKWVRLLPSLKAAVVEALCHPGESDDRELADLTPGWVSFRAEDLDALIDGKLSVYLKAHGVPLASFARAFASRSNRDNHRRATSS